MKIDKELLSCNPSLMPNHPDTPNRIDLKSGYVYTFQKIGVGLEYHTHEEEELTHTTAVMSGAIEVVKGDSEPEIYEAPSIVNFDIGVAHSITAVRPNTVIYNPFKAELKK